MVAFLSLSSDKHHRLCSSVIQRIIKVFQILCVIRGDERKGSYILVSLSGNCLSPTKLSLCTLVTFNSLYPHNFSVRADSVAVPVSSPPKEPWHRETKGLLHYSRGAACPVSLQGDPAPLMGSVQATAFGLAALAHPHGTSALLDGAKSW